MGRETRDELRRQLREEKTQNKRLRSDLHALGIVADNVVGELSDVTNAVKRLQQARRQLIRLLGRIEGIRG